MLLLLVACQWSTPTPPPAPVVAPVEDGPPPQERRGVTEVATPPEILRASDLQDRAATALLDVWFDPDRTTFEALGQMLERWGFTIVNGDGESWRVSPPPGWSWSLRLEPLPEVLRVREALDRAPMENGSFREGGERYGDVVRTWAQIEGGPSEVLTGHPSPSATVLPHRLPAGIIRCLAPARTEMLGGPSAGLGWERALQRSPSAWVLVLEDYGYCHAGGYLVLHPDATLDTLTIAGRSVSQTDPAFLRALARDTLTTPRALEDSAAVAALDILADAPDAELAEAVAAAAPGYFQESLYRTWAVRDPDAAVAYARAAESPPLRADAVSDDPALGRAALADPGASTRVQLAALAAWRPGPSEPPEILARLRRSPDPRVRERAWERTLDERAVTCGALSRGLATAGADAAATAWRDCPETAVRRAALDRVAAQDPKAAVALVAATLEAPETVVAGIAAARAAGGLGQHDLLLALVPRRTVSREVRLEALRILVSARTPGSVELIEVHGAYLGYRPLGSAPTADDRR